MKRLQEYNAATREMIEKFRTRIWEQQTEVDPHSEYHWDALAYGFFLALGAEIEVAQELAFNHLDLMEGP